MGSAFGEIGIGKLPHETKAALLGSQEMIEKLKTLKKLGSKQAWEDLMKTDNPLGETEPVLVIETDDAKSGVKFVSKSCGRIEGVRDRSAS